MRDYTELEQIRLRKLELLRAAGHDPYPPRAARTHLSAAALADLAARQAADPALDAHTPSGAYTVAGRLRSIRVMGKAAFVHLEDDAGRLQLYLRANELGDQFQLFVEAFDLGDILQASGGLFTTKTGEVTLWVKSFVILAKAISPLPAAKEEIVDDHKVVHSAFDNPEARYRERYADLAVNPEVRQIFRTRARISSAIRRFLDERDFVEVETPILQPLYGGAAARPFVTHHNQLHQDLYLRISFELYLKRLLVGGLERVYEIGRDFRNEGVSFKHNPEFTQLEFYWAYADYEQVMRLTEDMLAFVADTVLGTRQLTYQGRPLSLEPGWPRIPLDEAIAEFAGVNINDTPTADALRAAMAAKGLPPMSPTATRGKLVEGLLGDYVEKHLQQPTFIIDYPRDISPLAKARPGDPRVVERFEGYIAGMELCNAFTELNDPLDQEQRFLEMARDYGDGEDAQPLDEDYLRAMRYGMPPNGGFGMGLDRLTMLLTDKATIREVILFPHLRQRGDDKPE